MGGDTSKHRLYENGDPNEMRENVREHYEKMVVRLQDELDRLIKMYTWARESLENEMFSGMGYKKLTLGEKDIKKLKELTVGINNLVESKIKYDKAQKQLAASMTPAEERDAVIKYIVSLPGEARHELRAMLGDRGIWPWKS